MSFGPGRADIPDTREIGVGASAATSSKPIESSWMIFLDDKL